MNWPQQEEEGDAGRFPGVQLTRDSLRIHAEALTENVNEALREKQEVVARLARAAGVSPDSTDPVGAIEDVIRAGRHGHEELFAAEADYWQKRHGVLAGQVGAAVRTLSGGHAHYLMEDYTGTRPEPPVGTTFTNPETGASAWQRQDDGWHCTRADCRNCPAEWDEVCGWGGGVDGLVRHLPAVRVGTGGGETDGQ